MKCAEIDATAAKVGADGALTSQPSTSYQGWAPLLDGFSKVLLFFGGAGTVARDATGQIPFDRITTESLPITSMSPSPNLGALLAHTRTTQYLSPGFRYAPGRDVLSALATNPAALGFAEGWEVQTNSELNYPTRWTPSYLSAAVRWGQGHGWGVGFGYYLQVHDETQTFTFGQGGNAILYSVSSEHAFVGVVARSLTRNLSVALSGKVLIQADQVPQSVTRTDYLSGGTVVNSDTHTETGTRVTASADFGVALAYDPIPGLRLGLGAQNLLGRSERLDGGVAGDRTVGLGVAALLGRFQLATDVEYGQIGGVDFSAGTDVRVTRWLDLGAGYLSTQRSVRGYFRLFGALLSLRHGDDGWGPNVSARGTF